MLRSLITFIVGIFVTASLVMAQQTPAPAPVDPAVPADPAAPAGAATPAADGGFGDWWWIIIVIVVIIAVIWYFMQKRKATGGV